MRALLINGSPRKNGNTATLLGEAAETLQTVGWETEFIQLGGQKIHGCRGCAKCADKLDGRCVFNDDALNEILGKTLASDALILGTSCYFTDVTSELKAFIDRAGYVAFVNGGIFQGKIGAAIVSAGRAGATHAFDTMNHMFLMSKMIIPGSIYWNIGYGQEKGEVYKDKDATANMRHLAKAIAWLGNATAAHLSEYPA